VNIVFRLLFLFIIVYGCSQKQEQIQPPPAQDSGQEPSYIASLDITTGNPTVERPLVAQYTANSIEGKQVSFRFRWYVDGILVPGADKHLLEQNAFSKGARVSAEVVPVLNGIEGRPYRSQEITIQNALPIITTLELSPSPAFPGDKITAVVAGSDPDKNDTVTFLCEWQVDGQTVSGAETQVFDTSRLKKKSVIFVTVTPFDGQDKGPALQSPKGIVLSNRAPEFISAPPSKIENNVFLYQAVAKDTDGDPLTYSLVNAPSGMTINGLTGLIRWELPVQISERQEINVKISADDGDGGVATQEFSLFLEKK
jgi:hypothetical protein